MKKIKISIKTINDVKEFVNTVGTVNYEVDLISGRYAIDAKSIMGIFSLDLSKDLELNIHSDDCQPLLDELSKFIVE